MIKSSKRYVFTVITIIVIFVTYNFLANCFFTKQLVFTPAGYSVGDLARLAYLPSISTLKKNETTLPKKHIEMQEYNGQKIDVLTIGDSFFNGGGGGLNPYFQDYLASSKNLNVLNLKSYNGSISNTLNIILGNDFLEIVKPEYIIIESIEREIINAFSNELKIDKKISFNELQDYYKELNSKKKNEKTIFDFINNSNIKIISHTLGYKFSEKPFGSQVYKTKLEKRLFSKGKGDELYFYHADINNISLSTEKNVKKVNNNLNKLADILSKKSIKLYFIPAPDKYNVYYDYIEFKKHPRNTFFSKIRPLPKRYNFIDTKFILEEAIKKGQKDIYHVDDTHWSYKASEIIAENIILK